MDPVVGSIPMAKVPATGLTLVRLPPENLMATALAAVLLLLTATPLLLMVMLPADAIAVAALPIVVGRVLLECMMDGTMQLVVVLPSRLVVAPAAGPIAIANLPAVARLWIAMVVASAIAPVVLFPVGRPIALLAVTMSSLEDVYAMLPVAGSETNGLLIAAGTTTLPSMELASLSVRTEVLVASTVVIRLVASVVLHMWKPEIVFPNRPLGYGEWLTAPSDRLPMSDSPVGMALDVIRALLTHSPVVALLTAVAIDNYRLVPVM